MADISPTHITVNKLMVVVDEGGKHTRREVVPESDDPEVELNNLLDRFGPPYVRGWIQVVIDANKQTFVPYERVLRVEYGP